MRASNALYTNLLGACGLSNQRGPVWVRPRAATVKIQRKIPMLGKGVHAQVRLTEQIEPRDAPGARKNMPLRLANHLQMQRFDDTFHH